MKISDKLTSGQGRLCVVGLGYVGLPLAVEFAKKVPVTGFDINEKKLAAYRQGLDPTNEIGDVHDSGVDFTSDESKIREADFVIIAVPTPVYDDNQPDLRPLEGASRLVGRNLKPGAVVVYESTVFPGMTEDFCGPLLEEASGLKVGRDFKIAYSPERINPGDRRHRLTNIKKIVSGMDAETCQTVKEVYDLIIKETYPVSSIKAAEAVKVTENSQRDVNIAFMNECAAIFDKFGLDTQEIVNAMNTKWNALGFNPGLVGGHCIGVDPYYLIQQAERFNADASLLRRSREINNQVAGFLRDKTIKYLSLAGRPIKGARVGVLGITFKENVSDARNSKVADLVKGLTEYGAEVLVADPRADKADIKQKYGISLLPLSEMKNLDGLVVAVAHDEFKKLDLNSFYKPALAASERVLIDVKGLYPAELEKKLGFSYWRL
ncbi:nucleotide sugar dehydrogenase [Lactobacillus nasalidis]|nr:nucleotide sugar dehydrogenase [Lactobacillus nasalidis]